MSEANKALVVEFMNAMGRGDVETVKALSTDDLVAITTGTGIVSGTRNYEVIMQSVAAFPQITKAGVTVKILNLTAEDDRVAMEWDGFATMVSGKEYNNHYHNLMFIRDGKVCKMVEYCDLKLADYALGEYFSVAAK